MSKHQDELDKSLSSNAKLSVQLQSQTSRCDNLKVLVKKLKKEADEQNDNLVKEKLREEKKLREDLRGKNSDISLLKAEVYDYKISMKALRTEYQDIEKQFSTANVKIDELTKEKHLLSQDILDKNHTIDHLNTQLQRERGND